MHILETPLQVTEAFLVLYLLGTDRVGSPSQGRCSILFQLQLHYRRAWTASSADQRACSCCSGSAWVSLGPSHEAADLLKPGQPWGPEQTSCLLFQNGWCSLLILLGSALLIRALRGLDKAGLGGTGHSGLQRPNTVLADH